MSENLLTPKEAAIYLHEHYGLSMTVGALANRRMKAQPPDYIRRLRRVLYTATALDDFVEQGSQLVRHGKGRRGKP